MTEELRGKLLAYDEPFTRGNGISVTAVEDGYARVTAALAPAVLNHWDGPHDGLLFTAADVAAGTAVLTLRQESCVTVSSAMQFVGTPRVPGDLTAEGRVTRCGGHMAYCAAEVRDAEGNLLVTFQSTMYFTGQELPL